jgi:transcriptional regulator with XRE-family HTH domain
VRGESGAVKARAASRIVNVVGPQVRRFRCKEEWTQEDLAEKLQNEGWNAGRARIAKIEAGITWVTEIECMFLAKVFGVTTLDLYPKLNGHPPHSIVSKLVGKRVKLLMSPDDISEIRSESVLNAHDAKFCPQPRTKLPDRRRMLAA